jgi:hypothetical protein
MREVERRFGLEAITFDEFLASPQRSRRRMSHWLRGAGGVSPDQGVELRGLAQFQPPAQGNARVSAGTYSPTPHITLGRGGGVSAGVRDEAD